MSKKTTSNAISEDELLAYGAYVRVAYSLQHSNIIQFAYKSITLTWFIATYIAVGYTLSSLEINLPLNPLFIVSIICLASLLVIGVIWYLDLIVEEKKIASVIHKGINLEESNPEILPQACHSVVRMQFLSNYILMKSTFYLGICSILILTISAVTTLFLFTDVKKYWYLMPFLSIVFIAVLFILAIWVTKKMDPYPILENKKNGDDA
ncbi:MAG: hypothetical protein K1000chlam2_00088 [Chlamydiae bacterium]|nr:hypothetical protein [Chlamydiota bacterium]